MQTRNSTRGFVRLSVRQLVGPLVRKYESKSAETSVLDAFGACEGGTWGVDGRWMPLPTCPQRCCDPCHLFTNLYLMQWDKMVQQTIFDSLYAILIWFL